jgi:chemotaxis methyl-accepting protein methylase
MKITQKYGNTIHSDNTINKTITYHFNSLVELKEYWESLEKEEGVYSAQLNDLTIEKSVWVESEEYFETIGEEE